MIINKNSLDYYAKTEAGGKAYNLYLMEQQGLNLPSWVALGCSFFKECLDSSNVSDEINQCLQEHELGNLNNAAVAEKIRISILAAPISASNLTIMIDAYHSLGKQQEQGQNQLPLISARSSAADEDSANQSFAGQLSSFLYVNGDDDVVRYVKECWASAYSERSISYRIENDLSLKDIAVSVILQTMIEPDVSGVMFTEDPSEPVSEQYVISSVYGVGEGLVSDIVPSDIYWLDAQTGTVKNSDIGDKSSALRRGEQSGKPQEVVVQEDKRQQASLSDENLLKLWQLGRKLVEFYQQPQDVEWAIQKEEIYLLQTRPITTLKKNTNGFPNLWDNSNIVESYSGITLPLSFTFAQKNYHGVYTQFCEILGVPTKVVREMDYYLANMLGSINGRIYYNLYNWYKLVGVLPGFKQNKQFMETMMGVEEELPDTIEERIQPHPSWNGWLGKWRRVKTGFKFLWYHFTIQSMVDGFLKDFNHNYQYFLKKPYRSMSSDELFNEYLNLYSTFLGQWKAPIINDFLCMIHFGLLKKLTEKWLSSEEQNIQNDLLASEGGLESAAPTEMLIQLAVMAEANAGLKALLLKHQDFELLEIMNQSPYQDFYRELCIYIDNYGHRGIDEMKMETKDLHTDPSFLFVCLKNYLRQGVANIDKEQDKVLRENAEKRVTETLQGWRAKVYRWSLKHARKALKNRENTRFSRTRVYGLARNIFNCMGDKLSEQGILNKPNDIFYLTLDEIYGLHQGTLTVQNLKSLVHLRHNEYQNYENQEPKIRFLTRGPVYWKNQYLDEAEIPVMPDDANYDLKGLGCCPGIVEATVRVVHSLESDLQLDGEILVAKRTDPGWVPIFPSVSGILVERGSLLSHSAIVAREMGIPAVVGVKGLFTKLEDGMRVRMDGKTGTITILDESIS